MKVQKIEWSELDKKNVYKLLDYNVYNDLEKIEKDNEINKINKSSKDNY